MAEGVDPRSLVMMGVRRTIEKDKKQSGTKASKSTTETDQIAEMITLLGEIMKQSSVFAAVRTKVADIVSGQQNLDVMLNRLEPQTLVDLQSELLATSNSERKMEILKEFLMKDEVAGLKNMTAQIDEMNKILTAVSTSKNPDRRNISGLMSKIKKVIKKKLDPNAVSSEDDVDDIVTRLRATNLSGVQL